MLPNLLILTVTYGDRYSQLVGGPLAVAAAMDCKVVVVCNGATENVLKKLTSEKDNGSFDIDLLVNDVNLGSAGGFKAGLEYCQQLDFEYLLLLDDDNFLPTEALVQLRERTISAASFFPRRGRGYMEAAAVGINPYPWLAPNNSFLGLSLVHQINKKLELKRGFDIESYSFPWCPFGGLFLKREAVLSGILPREGYFLYCDDTEYTNRLSKKFGLYMLAGSCVVDSEDSWNVDGKMNVFSRLLAEEESWRVFYSVRNQSHFDLRRAQCKPAFMLNLIIFMMIFSFYAFSSKLTDRRHSPASRFALVCKSIWRGLRGRLGNSGIGW